MDIKSTNMYYRSNQTHSVEWNPADENIATKAVEEIVGEAETPVVVEKETAHRIREKYREKHIEEYGQDSPYYEDDND